MSNSNAPNNNVFDIKEKLATGSFGSIIFKAYNAALGQVAIAKKYPAAVTNDYEGFMKILNDVKSCNSAHIVGIYGYYKATKYFWVVMEFCLGNSVFNLMERLGRPLKESHIRTILNHSLRGLEALHSRNIIHTRVKARNLLLTTYGVCKLSEPSPPVKISDTGVNVDGIVGNSYWTSPEVLLEQGYTTASDIWSLGITVIEMAERHPPYAETHPSRVMVTIPARPPPQLLNPDAWSKPLKVFLACCLQKNPESRQSAATLRGHKIIKKADFKGMQTIVQKCMKVQQQGSRFYPDTIPKPNKGPAVEEIPLDDGVWAESGTLVWSPSQPLDSNQSEPTKRTASLSNQPFDPLRPKPALLKHSKSSPAPSRTGKVQQNKPNKPPPIQTEIAQTHETEQIINDESDDMNNFAECDSDTMKPSTFAKMKNNYTASEQAAKDTNLPSPDTVKPVPRLSKASETVQSEPPRLPKASETVQSDRLSKASETVQSEPPKKQTPHSPPSPSSHAPVKRNVNNQKRGSLLYQDSTVTLNMIDNYTPSYMDFYKDTIPALIPDEDEAPEVQCNLSRRNSIDRRGLELDRMQEELQKELDKLDDEYCSDLEEIKERYIACHEALRDRIEELQGGQSGQSSDGKTYLEFYGKLRKFELMLMLRFVETKHVAQLKEAKQHFDLQHRFLMDAMRNTTDRDEETRYNLSISENNEDQANCTSGINRAAQMETEDILRAIERIDYASAIAVE